MAKRPIHSTLLRSSWIMLALFSIFLQADAQTSRESSGIASGAWGGEHIVLEVSERGRRYFHARAWRPRAPVRERTDRLSPLLGTCRRPHHEPYSHSRQGKSGILHAHPRLTSESDEVPLNPKKTHRIGKLLADFTFYGGAMTFAQNFGREQSSAALRTNDRFTLGLIGLGVIFASLSVCMDDYKTGEKNLSAPNGDVRES